MDQKKLNIVLVVAVIVLAAAVAYMAYGKNTVSSPDPRAGMISTHANVEKMPKEEESMATPPANSITNSNVKTYTNTKYSFEFEYPSEWEVYADEYGPTDTDTLGIVVYAGPHANIILQKNPPEGSDGAGTYFSVGAYQPKTTFAGTKDCAGTQSDGTKITKVSLSGMLVNKCVFPSMWGTSMAAIVSKNNKMFYRVSSDKYDGTEKATVDKSIASFKITTK